MSFSGDNGTPATGIVETAQTNIPRFAAFVNKNKQGTKKPITPGVLFLSTEDGFHCKFMLSYYLVIYGMDFF